MNAPNRIDPSRPECSKAVYAPLEFRLRSGGKASGESALVTCPKCNQPAFIRRSERVTVTYKRLTAHCTNSGCGHIFELELTFLHTIVEGNIDRPDLALPVCPRDQVVHVLPGKDDDRQQSFLDSG